MTRLNANTITSNLAPAWRTVDIRRVGFVAVLALSFGAGGCKTLHHQRDKEAARQRWSEVRGRFKYQLARQQYESGQFDNAVMTATEAISLDPHEVGAYVVLARANLEQGKPATAETALRAASNVGLRSPALTYTEGVIHEQRDDLAGALELYRAARQHDATDVAYLIAEAECLVALSKPAEALTLLDEVGETYDDRASIKTLAAHIAARTGDVEGAIERYRDALAAQSTSPTIARELGVLLAQQHRCEQAITVLKPLIDRSDVPDDRGLIRCTLAACYLELNAAEAARDVLYAYANDHADDALAQLLVSKTALALNDLMTATRAIDLAQQTAPNHPELWLVRATIQWQRGAFADAAATLYDVLANRPDDADALCLLAEVLKSTRRSDGAKGYFERALVADPDCAWARAGLAELKTPPHKPTATSDAKVSVVR